LLLNFSLPVSKYLMFSPVSSTFMLTFIVACTLRGQSA
jgi:hypothetical protein